MRGHSPVTIATKLQGNASGSGVYVGEANIFTLFPLAITGTLQIETATVVGTITTAGNATVTVTGSGITGSPVALSVAVALDDTASGIATKIRAAIAANAAISALYTVGGTAGAVVLTRITAAANDGTLNVALADGTCVGITTAASSANTVAGAATGVGLTLTIEGKSPNGDWHALAAGVAHTTAGAKDPIQLSTFCDEIRATLTSWTVGQLTLTGIKAIRS